MIDIVVVTDRESYVWNPQDVDRLRREHRIIGNLSGCLSRAPRQNNHLGLPLKLLPEEATLIRDKGIGRLVQFPKLHEDPGPNDVETFNKIREDRYWEQCALHKEDRKRVIMQMASKIIEGKAKRLSRRKSRESTTIQIAKPPSETPKNEDMEYSDDSEKTSVVPENEDYAPQMDECIEEELTRVDDIVIPRESVAVQLFTECPWIGRHDAVDATWNFPLTHSERLRYRVFKDLWEKGNYLTSGSKFGGDFLVYEAIGSYRVRGVLVDAATLTSDRLRPLLVVTLRSKFHRRTALSDPLRYHALHIAICLPYHQAFTALDIVRKGRMGSNVKKNALLCSLDDSDAVTYLSIQWTGMS